MTRTTSRTEAKTAEPRAWFDRSMALVDEVRATDYGRLFDADEVFAAIQSLEDEGATPTVESVIALLEDEPEDVVDDEDGPTLAYSRRQVFAVARFAPAPRMIGPRIARPRRTARRHAARRRTRRPARSPGRSSSAGDGDPHSPDPRRRGGVDAWGRS